MRRHLSLAFVVSLLSPAAAAATAPVEFPAETVAAREAVFGEENVRASGVVDPRRVIFSWLGVTTLATSIEGRVVLLDSFLNGMPPGTCSPTGSEPSDPTALAGRTPLAPESLVALDPVAIFIGHGHYDHECYTGPIAAQTGAVVIGLPQHCELARKQAAGAGFDPEAVRCAEILGADSPFGAASSIRPFGKGLRVTAIRNLHSGAAISPPTNGSGAEAMLYRFALNRFSFTWFNSSGPLPEHAPELLVRLQALPPSDVALGATLGFGNPQQGFRDPADYVEALRVKRFYPLHHDLFPVPVLPAVLNQLMLTELTKRGLAGVWRPLLDPGDYLRPIVFKPRARRWE